MCSSDLYVASNGRPGPVVVDIPKDVQFAMGKYDRPKDNQHKTYRPQVEGDIEKIRAAVKLMAGAKKPVFYTGGGVINAGPEASALLRELVRLIHPNAQVPVKLGGAVVPNQIVFAVLAFMSIYGACVIVMTFLLLATGLDALSAFTAVIASINNTGPGLNEVGPARTFAGLTDFQTWVCTVAMLLGRLELFTLLVIFTPAFWRR